MEQAHGMLLRHHEKTQDLEYRQQKSVHALREDQVCFKINNVERNLLLTSQKIQNPSCLVSPIDSIPDADEFILYILCVDKQTT